MKHSRHLLFVFMLLGGALAIGGGPESATAAGYEVLHTFSGPDGGEPHASVVLDGAGNLYGATHWGGTQGYGTVYRMTRNANGTWVHRVLHNFSGPDGAWPAATPILDAAGNLYGTTYIGGSFGCGVVYKLAPNPDGTWSERVLHAFTGGWDGCQSDSDLIFDADGNLYGETQTGGSLGYGVVFKLRPGADGAWTERVLHSFRGGRDGSTPRANLVFDAAGSLYGTTIEGGYADQGTVFRLTPQPDGRWTKSTLHHFYGNPATTPLAGLIVDGAGNLYGTTLRGGPYDGGTVFKLARKADDGWRFQTLHVFLGRDGLNPWAPLLLDAAGSLYGTTRYGGNLHLTCEKGRGCGTVFKLTQNVTGSWIYQVLHRFGGGAGGAEPLSQVIRDSTGVLYGTANYRGNLDCSTGSVGCGTVFRITP
jgi:uncharacterized repeat protein (TIGR03803 family)